MGSHTGPAWRHLSIGVVGGGIGGMSAALALRRAGHSVTIYERNDFVGEVGASISCGANGTRWLDLWKVDFAKGDPVVLKQLISRDWRTGEPTMVYNMEDYEEKWGYLYYMFHRQYMHAMLQDAALQEEGEGEAVRLCVNHKCEAIDIESGLITFANSHTAHHDLIIGADGIGSVVRKLIGLTPDKKPADQSCLHANVRRADVVRLGLVDYSQDAALEYWGGHEGKWDKIVLSPCNGGELLSYYCFFAREAGDYSTQCWANEDRPVEELLAPYPELDSRVKAHLAVGIEIRPWRLWVHQPYPYLVKNTTCLIGDAGHPMFPHQSQGACMAIEDAAALGILFSKPYFGGDVADALQIYEQVRLPRATRVQASAARAATNINERIGFSSNKTATGVQVEDERNKLTIEEMNEYDMYKDIEEGLARQRHEPFTAKYIRGLPIGLTMSNGVTIGE